MTDEATYVKRVLSVLQSNPTAADIDFLVEAYTSIGYLAAVAERQAEESEAVRKFNEASEATRIREDAAAQGRKVTADEVTARVLVNTYDFKKAEIRAYEKARKLKNLLDAIREAINAIKYLGRYDTPVNLDRIPAR